MFNIQEIKKAFLTTFLLMAMVVFACPSYAEELDCSSKTGYEKVLCEQQQEINKKSQKSKDKINDAQKKQAETKQKIKDGDTKSDKKADKAELKAQKADITLKSQEASKGSIDNNKAKIAEAQDLKAKAQQKMTEALKSGRDDLAKEAQKEMIAYNQEIEDRKDNLKDLEKVKKSADKAETKAEKAETKAQEKAEKAEKKAEKKVVDTAKKAEKSAAKTSEKADKEVKKLQEKCEKTPEKCDTAALQAALAKQDAAKAAAAAAKAQREDLDGTAAALAKAKEDKDAADAAAANNIENAGDTEAEALNADKQGQAEAAAKPKRCADATGVFEIVACKAMTTLADLRQVVYLFAGFGLIAFAWSAIFNKISWKHFSQIALSLFLLSMMGTFIGYFGYDGDVESLSFGHYLADDHEHAHLTGGDGLPSDCDKRVDAFYANMESNSGKAYEALGDCPIPIGEVVVTAKKPKEKWSLKDLKGTVQAGIGAIQKANSAYQTAKSTVENVVSQAQTIGNAIKNGEGGLTGILNTMNTVATASGSIMNSGQLLANNLAYNVGGISDDMKNAGMTNKEREQRTKDKARLDTLTKMCNDGACNGDGPNAKKLRSEMEMLKNKESTQDTKINQWIKNDEKGGGATILAGVNKVGNIGTAATNTVRNVSNAAQNGATIGGGIGTTSGDILGSIFGAATALGDVTSMGGNPNFDFKSEGTKRTEKAAADQAAHQKTSDFVAKKEVSPDGARTTETRGDGSVKTVDSKTGTTTVKNKDGSVTTTSKGGSTVEVKADGTKIVTNSNGKVTTTTPDGKTTTDESNIKTKYSGDASIKDQAKNKTPEQIAAEAKAASDAAAAKAAAAKQKKEDDARAAAAAKANNSNTNNSSQSSNKANEYNGPLLRPNESSSNVSYKGTDGYNFNLAPTNVEIKKKEVTDGKNTGVTETVTKNGVTTTTSVIYQDTIRNKDGSVSQKDAEGRVMTTHPNGRIVIKDKNGKVTYDSAAKK